VVEHEADCYENAEILRGVLHDACRTVRRGGVILREGEPYPCRVCARGDCRPLYAHEKKPETSACRPSSGGPPRRGPNERSRHHRARIPLRLLPPCGHV
jgi:hypothetical protein